MVTRRVWADTDTADYARRALAFPGLRVVLRVDSAVRKPGCEPTQETRYFATSLDPGRVSPAELLRHVRGHRQVENGLHFVEDRWWGEDRHHAKRPRVAEGLAVLVNAVVTVLAVTADPDDDRPLRARADALGWLLDTTLAWFTGKNL